MRVLVAGWFSFSDGHATAGDLLARDIILQWLRTNDIPHDTAAAEPFTGDLRWQDARSENYSAVIFVCGPFQRGELESTFLERFSRVPVFGVNLSMIENLDRWNPFRQLWERDSNRTARPDLVFLSDVKLVPVIGVCKVEPYPAGRTDLTDDAIDRLLSGREATVVQIDTRLDVNSTGLRTPAEVESLIARVDVLITTRLHGTVFALKNGVPVIPIDPELGGFKIKRQTDTLKWPICFTADHLVETELSQALDYCLRPDARQLALKCAAVARESLANVQTELITALKR